jgi:hypothetical protein
MSQAYAAKQATVEAAFVSLAGASLAVVAIDGKAHVIPAEVFLALYQEQAEPPKPETKRARDEKQYVQKALAPKIDKLDQMAMRDLDKLRRGEYRMEDRV